MLKDHEHSYISHACLSSPQILRFSYLSNGHRKTQPGIPDLFSPMEYQAICSKTGPPPQMYLLTRNVLPRIMSDVFLSLLALLKYLRPSHAILGFPLTWRKRRWQNVSFLPREPNIQTPWAVIETSCKKMPCKYVIITKSKSYSYWAHL